MCRGAAPGGLRFFIPVRLVQLEYLGGTPQQAKNKQEEQENKRYRSAQEFAFFAANFGYSKSEYLELTPAEKQFLMKAYEEKTVADSTLLSAAVANAVGNVLRKKGKRPKKLWRKCPRAGDEKEREQVVAAVRKMEQTEDKRWVDLVYQANGIRRRKGGEKQ